MKELVANTCQYKSFRKERERFLFHHKAMPSKQFWQILLHEVQVVRFMESHGEEPATHNTRAVHKHEDKQKLKRKYISLDITT